MHFLTLTMDSVYGHRQLHAYEYSTPLSGRPWVSARLPGTRTRRIPVPSSAGTGEAGTFQRCGGYIYQGHEHSGQDIVRSVSLSPTDA